jgi:hypothetical protein
LNKKKVPKTFFSFGPSLKVKRLVTQSFAFLLQSKKNQVLNKRVLPVKRNNVLPRKVFEVKLGNKMSQKENQQKNNLETDNFKKKQEKKSYLSLVGNFPWTFFSLPIFDTRNLIQAAKRKNTKKDYELQQQLGVE